MGTLLLGLSYGWAIPDIGRGKSPVVALVVGRR